MNVMLTCAACDRTSWDVHSRIVELREPRSISVTLADGSVVPAVEHYGVEPRCTDPEACRSRQEVKA